MLFQPLQTESTYENCQFPLVMLIDDSKVTNFINERFLNRHSFHSRILIYENSIKAFEYLLNIEASGDEIPSIIFLDLSMPLMDGQMFLKQFELLSENIKSSCKIVILSNSGNPTEKTAVLSNKNVIAFFCPPLIKGNLDQLNQNLRNQTKITLAKQHKTSLTSGFIGDFIRKQSLAY